MADGAPLPPGLKKKVVVEELEVGMVIRATVKPDDFVCEGVVYTVDPVTRTLVLYNRVSAESDECSIRLVPKHSITNLQVIGEATEERAKFGEPTPVDDKELEKRERTAMEAMEKAMAALNPRAPKPGQAVFDALAKTMDCAWLDNSVVVLDQVKIDPPYEPDNCLSLDGDQNALDRIRRILANLRKKWHKQRTADGVGGGGEKNPRRHTKAGGDDAAGASAAAA